MSKKFGFLFCLVTLWFLPLGCGPQSEPEPETPSNPSAGQVGREDWLTQMRIALPAALCVEGQYFRECFQISEADCVNTLRASIQSCVPEIEPQMPAVLQQPQDGTTWGQALGMCAGTSAENVLLPQKVQTPRCNDPSAW